MWKTRIFHIYCYDNKVMNISTQTHTYTRVHTYTGAKYIDIISWE